MLLCPSPQMTFGSSPEKKYACAIHPNSRGTNRPPAALHASRVLIDSQRAVLGASILCTPARTESASGPQKSTCSCQCAIPVGSLASRSAGVALGGAAYIAPTSFIAPLSSFLYRSDTGRVGSKPPSVASTLPMWL